MSRAFGLLLAAALALVSLSAPAAEPRFPALTGRVVDQAGLLSPSTESKLSALLEEHERRTSNQVVVATVPSLQGYDIADFAVRLGRAWSLGQRGRDNGIILLVAPRERAVRIEVGYGLEGALPDARAFAIINGEILPRFRAGDMEGGIVQGTLAILGSIEGTYTPKPRAARDRLDPEIVPILMMVIVFVIISVFRSYGGGGRRRGAGFPIIVPGGFGSGAHRGGWGGGGFSGGGGSFGGGGASGRW